MTAPPGPQGRRYSVEGLDGRLVVGGQTVVAVAKRGVNAGEIGVGRAIDITGGSKPLGQMAVRRGLVVGHLKVRAVVTNGFGVTIGLPKPFVRP